MNVKLLRVLGRRSAQPAVVAFVDDYRVRWNVATGWCCDCEDDGCEHVDVVADLLDPRVTGDRDDR